MHNQRQADCVSSVYVFTFSSSHIKIHTLYLQHVVNIKIIETFCILFHSYSVFKVRCVSYMHMSCFPCLCVSLLGGHAGRCCCMGQPASTWSGSCSFTPDNETLISPSGFLHPYQFLIGAPLPFFFLKKKQTFHNWERNIFKINLLHTTVIFVI